MIELKINADTPEELIATINGLATLGNGRRTFAPAEPFVPPDEEPEERPQPEPVSRGGRRKKADAPAVTDLSGGDPASGAADTAGAGQIAGPAATTVKSDLVGDTLSQQIKEANAESRAEKENGGEVVTLEVVQQVFGQATAPGGKLTMLQAQALLKDNFKDAAGEPVRRIRDLLPADYAAAIAKLEG
jgi:hypothetical protein